MIPVSIDVKQGEFLFIVIGDGLLELLFPTLHTIRLDLGKLMIGDPLLIIRGQRIQGKEAFDDPKHTSSWHHYELTFNDAASLIEWASQRKAQGNWEPAPNKSSRLLSLYGKSIITPAILEAEWSKVKR